MRKDLLLTGVVLLLIGLVVSFIPVQLAPSDSIANNYWIGVPILLIGVFVTQLGIVFKETK